jgi:hypothetical protein
MGAVRKAGNRASIIGTIFAHSLKEALRNRAGIVVFFSVPVLFLGAVYLTAGEGYVSIKLYYPGEVYSILLVIRHVCFVFGAAALCGFLSGYFALILFHRDFEYYRFCVFAGLRPLDFLLGRFGFFVFLILFLALGTCLFTMQMVEVNRPADAFIGFLLMGIIYGACGGIIGILSRDFLVAFLLIAVLADIDAAWLQNPVYYTAGQNIGLIRWLPAFYPGQQIFSSAFMEDPNPLALWGSALAALLLLVIFFVIISIRFRSVARACRRARPATGVLNTPA